MESQKREESKWMIQGDVNFPCYTKVIIQDNIKILDLCDSKAYLWNTVDSKSEKYRTFIHNPWRKFSICRKNRRSNINPLKYLFGTNFRDLPVVQFPKNASIDDKKVEDY